MAGNDKISLADIRLVIDNFLDELDIGAEKVKQTGGQDLRTVRETLDRWEEIRSTLKKFQLSLSRRLHANRTAYEDGMRKSLSRGVSTMNAGMHFEERKAKFETDNIEELQRLRSVQQVVDELKIVLDLMKSKEHWLESIRFEILHRDKIANSVSSREFND